MNRNRKFLTLLVLILLGIVLKPQSVSGQCSSLTLQVLKDSIGSGNVKYTYGVDKDSSCLPYKLKVKVGGYPSNHIFKFYVGTAAGISSSNDTFSTILVNSGYYKVKVEIINTSGSVVCTIERDSIVRAGVGQQPLISFQPSILCNGPDSVTITDSTPGIVNRIWIVDGVTYQGNQKVLRHKFSSTGYKKVEVLLTSQGDSCQLYKKYDSAFYVTSPISVDFSASPTSGCKAHTTSFTPSLTLNGNTVSTYSWSLPGGNPSSSTNSNTGNVVYNSAGAFNASLSVTSTLGCTYSNTKSNYINVGDTFVLNLTIEDSTLCYKQYARIYNQTTGLPAGGTMNWITPSTPISYLNKYTFSKDSCQINFDKIGNYTLTAEYTYNGCKSTKSIDMRSMGPGGLFDTKYKSNCSAPTTFRLGNKSKYTTGNNVTYYWYISDSANKFTPAVLIDSTHNITDSPDVTLPKLGSYSVRLAIKDHTTGCVDTNTSAAGFFKLSPPTASMRIRDTAGAVNTTRQFCTCERAVWKNSSGVYTQDSIYVWFTLYNKMDTTSILKEDTINVIIAQFTRDTINYRYCDTGSYLGRMITWSDGGCIDTVFDTIKIAPPVAQLSFDTTQTCVNGSVNITGGTTPEIGTLQHYFYSKHQDSSFWVLDQQGAQSTFTKQFTEPGKYSIAYVARSTASSLCMDSLVQTNVIKVGYMYGDLKSATAFGCKNATIKFDTTGVINIHPANTSNTIKYEWTVTPSTNVTIANPYAASTNITFGDNGVYDITLKYKNSDSCEFTTSAISVTIGLTASFSLPSQACYKSQASVTNNTQNNPTNFQWKSVPSAGVVFDSAAANNFSASAPGISFPDSGTYRIEMTAFKGSCKDTISQFITVQRVVPRFSLSNSSDSINQCAPKFIKFKSFSIHGDYHYWDFGDGQKKTSYIDTTNNLYRTNDSCFDVKLVAISNLGCSDTLTKYCYIKFKGPVPKYIMNKTIGCEPLTVTFTDQSYNIVSKSFDYGDGNTTNGSLGSHTYYSSTPGATYDVYVTKLTAYDNLCSQPSIYPDPAAGHTIDTIKVFKKSKAYFYADTTFLCEGNCVQFTDTSKYVQSWYWDFGDGTTDTVQHPSHCYAPGTYNVKLKVNNEAGCGDSIVKSNYITVRNGSKAKFVVNDSQECTSLTVNFTDSSKFTTIWYWEFGDGNTSTSKNNSHSYTPGYYKVKLVTDNQYGCKDSIEKDSFIQVYNKPSPKMYASTNSGCEPFSTQLFADSSTFTDNYLWVIMNGTTLIDTSTSINPSFSLIPGTYNVNLYNYNSFGCSDSLKNNSYLFVYNRAKPDFYTSDTIGCDTIVSSFTNNSSFANQFRWDFGNGNTSTATSPSSGYGVGLYSVKLWANNANNCPDSITQTNRIQVVNKPKPVIYSGYTIGCEPFTTTLNGDSTQYANQYLWDLGNGNTSTGLNPTESYSPGTYSVKLVAYNSYGCSDSVTKTTYITVYIKPTADFQADNVWLCYNSPVVFTDLSISDVAISKYDWDFGDFTGDTTSSPLPHYYQVPGLKTVTLRIENSHGCRDTLTIPSYIYMDDSIPPTQTQIQYVTYNNGNLDIFWEVNNDTSFFQNKLYRDDLTNPNPPGINIFSSNINTDITFSEMPPAINADQFVYEYTMTSADSCGWTSNYSNPHRNMVLKANTLSPMRNIITWTPYVGWGANLKEYQVYKGATGTGQTSPTLSLFRTIAPTDTSMIDSLLCDSDYYYQVYAIHNTETWQSQSNPAMNHPPFISPDTAVSVEKVTVYDNKWVYLRWSPSGHPDIKQYVIDRFDSLTGVWKTYHATTRSWVTEYMDINDVNVNAMTYSYRVSVEDFCGNMSPLSTDFGRTIRLDANIENDFVVLRWSPYDYWSNTVQKYIIQINYGPNDWRTVYEATPSEFEYIDKKIYEDLYTNYCYRIVAIENDAIPDTSISNIDCAVVPSRIFIANSFSPNGRGPEENEVFKPKSLSLYSNQQGNDINDYVFRIYNRWGEIVFETHDAQQGWDGTFKGKACPAEVYAYTIRARGKDGFPYELRGIVHLMR